MCISVIGLAIEALVLVGAVISNFNKAWVKNDDQGGLWKYCTHGGDKCERFGQDDAKRFNHIWKEIVGARAMIIMVFVIAIPLIIFLIIGLSTCCCGCSTCINIIFAALQLAAFCAGCVLMTHGFITRESDGTKAGYALYVAWVGCFFSLCLVVFLIIACSPCCKKLKKDKDDEEKRRKSSKSSKDKKMKSRKGSESAGKGSNKS